MSVTNSGYIDKISQYVTVANSGDAVALKNGKLENTALIPAKQGFFGRLMQWIRGEPLAKARLETNRNTNLDFAETVKGAYDSSIVYALEKLGLMDFADDKPLASRSIKNVTSIGNELNVKYLELKELTNKIEEYKNLKLEVEGRNFDKNNKEIETGFITKLNEKKIKIKKIDKMSAKLVILKEEYQKLIGDIKTRIN